jgi:peptidyl-tRNA hydrolase, PTH2 family
MLRFFHMQELPPLLHQTIMKQVIVVNAALKLPKGKLAAQVAHAAVGAFLEANEQRQKQWLVEGMPKVVLRGNDAEELIELQTLALRHYIPACLIRDAGRTVVPSGTVTCLGLGPADDVEVDAVTGKLKLLH